MDVMDKRDEIIKLSTEKANGVITNDVIREIADSNAVAFSVYIACMHGKPKSKKAELELIDSCIDLYKIYLMSR